jgi:glycerate 2-kinase
MVAGVEAVRRPCSVSGLVIVAARDSSAPPGVRIRVAGHPSPDPCGLRASAELIRTAAAARGDPIVCLISGGASSLLVRPAPPISLDDLIAVNRALLACGADIREVNTVRKHLSLVKGGGLLRFATTRPLLTLIVSDVVGDDPTDIGSGPSVPDPTTFADAMQVVDRYTLGAHLPTAVRNRLRRGVDGLERETLKPGDAAIAGTEAVVVGSNAQAVAAAADAAERLGYEALAEPSSLVGDTTEAAYAWARRIVGAIEGRRRCAIIGGETTVTVVGSGRGGRNQEFALAAAALLRGRRIAVLSAGTDGIDGPTDAAGAFVDGSTLDRAAAGGLDPAAALGANDSHTFFDQLGDLLRCGPTGTNVMDLKIAIGVPSFP